MDLDEFRKSRRFTRQELSDKLKISVCAYDNYVHGRQLPRADIIERIEDFTKKRVTLRDITKNWRKKNGSTV